jgi:flavin reductase (DIM6/NTAB) family NADH-FMN oxidoreductase RutF
MIIERSGFIEAMRRVASSVTVVTTDGPHGRHGATVSAFCSVSADPPSVLVCLRADSRIAALVRGNRTFCVNVLKESARELAEAFAGRFPTEGTDRLAGIPLICSQHSAPVLAASATALSCILGEEFPSGSHVILVGQVVEVHHGDEQPLAYLDGRYGSVLRATA